MKRLARTPYMRNLWYLMKTFSVLPTDPSFRALTDNQIDLMIYSVQEDNREFELAQKGLTVDSQYYDTDFEDEVWNKPEGEWEVLRDGDDPDDIARQVEELTKAEDLRNLAMKFDSLEEYNAYRESGGLTQRESEVEEYINKQLALAEEKARRLNAVGGTDKGTLIDDRDRANNAMDSNNDSLAKLDKEAIEKSIALFNAKNEDENKNKNKNKNTDTSIDDDPDDDFTML